MFFFFFQEKRGERVVSVFVFLFFIFLFSFLFFFLAFCVDFVVFSLLSGFLFRSEEGRVGKGC